MWIAQRRSFLWGLSEQNPPIFLQQKRHQHAADTCGDDLADADGEAEEPPCVGNVVGVLQDEGHDGDVGKNRGEGEQKTHAAQGEPAQGVGSERAEQGGKRAEDDVVDDSAGQKIGEHTSDGKARHGGKPHEEGQDAERLGQAALDGTGGKPHGGREVCQHNVGCRDHGGQNGIANFLITGMETVHFSKQRSAGAQTSPADLDSLVFF